MILKPGSWHTWKRNLELVPGTSDLEQLGQHLESEFWGLDLGTSNPHGTWDLELASHSCFLHAPAFTGRGTRPPPCGGWDDKGRWVARRTLNPDP